MLYLSYLVSILETLLVIIPALLSVAFVTVAERKTMASMQRRLGPNIVGFYGTLQAFADALKLLLKEYVAPTQANIILFFLGPFITLIFSLLGYMVIPFGPGLTIFDFNLGILFLLAVSSLSTYGILLAGWSANSKYAFLGSLRSTAQLISYELILSSAILLVIFVTNSLSLTVNVEAQKAVYFLFPLLPAFLIFFIGAVAETNRAPFDLAEAESELVSGFMTEHSSVIFVFFFLAEYASIVLICILISILFIGGYNINFAIINNAISFVLSTSGIILDSFINVFLYNSSISYKYIVMNESYIDCIKSSLFELTLNSTLENAAYSLSIAVKSFIMVFVFIWVRASFPRIRFDQLMVYCWTILLPIVFAFIIVMPCALYIFDILPNNVLF